LNLLPALLSQIATQHWSEWIAVSCAILYLVLAARGNPWCWALGMTGCAFWAYAAFEIYGLYIDGGLQLFYIGISFLGFYKWKYGGSGGEELPVSTLPLKYHIAIWIGGIALSLLVGAIFDSYTDATAPFLNAFPTVFSVLTTFMAIWKKLENWLYWLLIDTVYVYLYWSQGGYLFVLLFFIYLVMAVIGFLSWKKQFSQQVI
jgi:nicotinamide mononucleotide transporter